MFGRNKTGDDKKDWVVGAADVIEGVIDSIRDKTVVPLTTIARALVYGVLAAIVGLAALVILAVLLVRLLDVYLDNIPHVPHGVWFADLILGAVFILSGMIAWSLRSPRHQND